MMCLVINVSLRGTLEEVILAFFHSVAEEEHENFQSGSVS
jgi:hypothetical protein